MQDRKERLKRNTVASLVFQVTNIVCGFILPRLILARYGSEVNGLVGSITQFLELIAFLELGVGAVVQASLYKPLAVRDLNTVSRIASSARRFFSKIALALGLYTAGLLLVYPRFAGGFDRAYTGALILAIGVGTFAQYYLGLVDRLLLTADQRGYVQYAAQTAALLLNTAASAALIEWGADIRTVKLSTALIFLIRPMALRLYVRRHYHIERRSRAEEEPIRQKWNGIAQHVSYYVLEKTDVIVLTLLSTLKNVSVYSVYHMVIYGVKNLFLSLTYGVQALMGELIAKEETERLRELFDWTEWLLHTGTVFLFGCTGVLILPFIQVYTSGINDANYQVPLFALLITLAHAGHCLRLPYDLLILAAGHFRQTQRCHITAALLNIAVSVLTVKLWGLAGVALGTLCAMAYQTVWMALYDSRHILHVPIRGFWIHLLADGLTALPAGLLCSRISMRTVSVGAWLLLAAETAGLWALTAIGINWLFFGDKVKRLAEKGLKKLKRS